MKSSPTLVFGRKTLFGGEIKLSQSCPIVDERVGKGKISVELLLVEGLLKTNVTILSKFTGNTLAGMIRRPDDKSSFREVSARKTAVRGTDGNVVEEADREITPVVDVPKGVSAKSDEFFVKAQGPLKGVLTVLAKANPMIAGPAMQLLGLSFEILEQVRKGKKTANGNSG